MHLKKEEKSRKTQEDNEENLHCSVCDCEISEDDCGPHDGMCWECWDDQLNEESDMCARVWRLDVDCYNSLDEVLKARDLWTV